MSKKLNRLGQILTKNPNNRFQSGEYFNLRRRFKATYKKRNENLRGNYHKIKKIWKLLKQIKDSSCNKLSEYQSLPSLNELDNYYKNLLQKSWNLTKQDFPEPLNTKQIDSLNQKMTRKEIKESIKYLKTEKAPGLDQRNDKMLWQEHV